MQDMEPGPTRELDKHAFMQANENMSNSEVRQARMYAGKGWRVQLGS